MDIVDALTKIKNLEKQVTELTKSLKEANKTIKSLKSSEKKLLDECNVLSENLAKYAPFNDYDEIIIKDASGNNT